MKRVCCEVWKLSVRTAGEAASSDSAERRNRGRPSGRWPLYVAGIALFAASPAWSQALPDTEQPSCTEQGAPLAEECGKADVASTVARASTDAEADATSSDYFQASGSENSSAGAYLEGANALAAGEASNAVGDGASALGSGANAMGLNATAVGVNALALGEGTLASGEGAQAMFSYASAIGSQAQALDSQSSALGFRSMASNVGTTAVGSLSLASGGISAAFGYGAEATHDASTAVGAGAVASGRLSSAIGYAASAAEEWSLAIGSESEALARSAVAIGDMSEASGVESIAIGGAAVGVVYTEATGHGAIALGSAAYAPGNYSMALGYVANAAMEGAIAIGYRAAAVGQNSMSIGWRSVNFRPDSLSLGDVGMERHLVNLAPGVLGTDAVNLSQLQSLGAVFGGSIDMTDGVLGMPTYGVQGQAFRNVGAAFAAVDARFNQIGAALGELQGSGGGQPPSATGASVNYTDDSRGAIELQGAAGTRVANVADGEIDSDATNLGQLKRGDAATLSAANAYADGSTSRAMDSARTYSDGTGARALASANAYTDQRFLSLNDRFEELERDVDRQLAIQDRRIDRMGAMSSAMMGMAMNAAQARTTGGRIAVGAGFQGGESAMAVGYTRRIGERASFSIGSAFNSDDQSASLGFGLDL